MSHLDHFLRQKILKPSKDYQNIIIKHTKMITWLPSKSLTKELVRIIMNISSSNVESIRRIG